MRNRFQTYAQRGQSLVQWLTATHWPTLMDRITTNKGIYHSWLFHRHALRQISGLVYVAASADGYVVGEELEGDYFEDG